MRTIGKITGLCLMSMSMLVMGMALAGSASAEPGWLLCSEGVNTSNTKYENSQCSKAKSTGKWESVAPAVPHTVRIVSFTLKLIDTETSVGKSTVKCNGKGSKGSGIIELASKGVVRVFEIENAKENCEAVEGGCKKGEVEKVKGANLPWAIEMFETEAKSLTKIAKGPGAAGEPGWEVTCNTLLGTRTDTCTSNTGKEGSAELKNETAGGVLLVRGVLEKNLKASCTEGKKESGESEGQLAILSAHEEGLAIGPRPEIYDLWATDRKSRRNGLHDGRKYKQERKNLTSGDTGNPDGRFRNSR